MARISQDQTQERHAYVLELFREQPELSRADALAAYKARFGAALNPKTLNELREQAQAGSQGASADDVVAALSRSADAGSVSNGSTASSTPKPKAAKGAKGVKNVFIDASAEQLQFLESVLAQLQEAGATNLRVDHATERWMVVSVESK